MKRVSALFIIACAVFFSLSVNAQEENVTAISKQNDEKVDVSIKKDGREIKLDAESILSAGTNVKDIVIKEEITAERGQNYDLYRRLIQTGIIILIGYLLMMIIVRIINRRVKSLKAKHIIRKNTVYILTFLITLFIIFVWIRKLSSLTIFLGVASAGIALALQEALLCVAGWFLILVRHPFDVGDRVELGGVKGDVIDIRLFQTSLLEMGNWVEADQSTGRIVNIPNSAVFKKENYNYNRGFEFIWNEVKVLITFESDWKRASEIMLEHGNEMADGMENVVKRKIEHMTARYMIYYEKLTPITYVKIKESGVEVTLRYLTEAKRRRSTSNELSMAILDDFAKEPKVNFAYTTYRIVKLEDQ